MLDFIAQPNILLEALSYLGRRAAGNTWEHMEQRIIDRHITAPPAFTNALKQLKAVTARLDNLGEVTEENLSLFQNLDGMAHNTIGTGSLAFLLFYGTLEAYQGDADRYLREVSQLPAGKVAYHMALALDLADDCVGQTLSDRELMDLVLSTSLPDSSKIAILDAYRSYPVLIAQAAVPLRAVLKGLSGEWERLSTLSQILRQKIQAESCEGYLARTSRLTPAPGVHYHLRPFLFGMDTNLTSNEQDGVVQVYCGILRDELLAMVSSQMPIQEDVYEAYKLLGDRTRFDILCYLRERSAYGQELSSHLGLSRNTIHHHMGKLISYGLVRCIAEGNRVYYSLDSQAVDSFMNRQRELFSGK